MSNLQHNEFCNPGSLSKPLLLPELSNNSTSDPEETASLPQNHYWPSKQGTSATCETVPYRANADTLSLPTQLTPAVPGAQGLPI